MTTDRPLPTAIGTAIRVRWSDSAHRDDAPSDVLILAAGRRSGVVGWESLSGCWGATALADEIDGYETVALPLETRFDVCSTCQHYRSEHDLDGGPCRCDVLVSRILEPSHWARCACAMFIPDALPH